MTTTDETTETTETTEPLADQREVDEQLGEDLGQGPAEVDEQVDADAPEEPETFPREYVQKLRDEAAKYRQRAQQTDAIAQRLHVALVAATGRLADPDDLPYAESHLDDPEALTEALDALVARKPHLASRRPYGDVGQGVTTSTDSVDLAGLLRLGAN